MMISNGGFHFRRFIARRAEQLNMIIRTMNIDEEEPNCNICFEVFDDKEHSPRTLRCGHTLCTPCIDVLVKKSLPDRVCPECRKTLKISNSSHLPISYTILRLSRALAKSKPAAEVQIQVIDNNTCMKHGAPTISWCPLSDKWHCFKCVHEDRCDSLLSVPEAFLHIKQNYTQIVESKLSNAINHSATLKAEKETLTKEISSSEKRVEELTEQFQKIDEWCKLLEADEAEMVEAATTIRLTKSLKRLKRDMSDFDSWLEKSKPSVKSRLTRAGSLALSSLDFSGLTERLCVTRKMYIKHESKDLDIRYGRLSVTDQYLVMSALECDDPPRDAAVIPFDEVVGTLNFENAIAFFDIKTDDVKQGRVYMEMLGDTSRARQFLKLCTGEEGPCYKDSELREFEEDHHRFVRGGVACNNIDGDAIVEGITVGGVYCKTLVPGMLNGWKSNDEHWALFDIVLECKPGYEDDYVFGRVLSGLDVLRGSCESSENKKTIEIADCGIVVSDDFL